MSPVVVLVGPPGAGKSTVAAALAELTGTAVRDTDADVEAEAGTSVQDIFLNHGEQHFRRLEEAAVARALTEHDGVLALGGGAVLSEATRERLGPHAVVYLETSLATAAQRVGMNSGRPLLLGNVRAQMKQLIDARRPLYTAVATWTVATDELDPQQVAEQIIRLIEENR